MDRLGVGVIILSMIFAVAGNIADSFIVQIPAYLLLAYELVRYMSRDISARRREDELVCGFLKKLFDPLRKKFRLIHNRFRDRKTHCYFTCPKCHNALRVPKGKGEITITCPVCGEKLDRKT